MPMVFYSAAAASLVIAGAIAFLCVKRRSKRPMMEEQLGTTMSTTKRPRFQYTPYKESVRGSNRRKDRQFSTRSGFNSNFLDADKSLEMSEFGDDTRNPDEGYIDVVATASPGSAALAFAKYENETNNVVGGRQFRLPSFGGAIAPTSRTNPLFDAATLAAVFDTNDAETDDWIEIGGADDDSDIEENGGFDLAGRFSPPPTAEESYGFGFGQTLTETDILSGAKDEADLGYGFDVVIDDETEPTSPLSGPEADQGDSEVATDPDMLKQLQQQMDNALEALNTPTEIHERIAGILRISELLEKDPVCVQECIDMNGVLSLMSAMKEDSDETMQRVGMRALNTLADNDQALAEILQYHAVNFWGHALEVDSLWKDALVGLEKARRSEAAVHLMISENILHRLCDRLPFATVDEQSQIFAVFVAIATTAERLSKLKGMFDALQIAMGNSSNRKMLLDVALEVIEAATGSFGVEAISQINESGLSAALAAMPSSVLAENATLRRVLAYLEE